MIRVEIPYLPPAALSPNSRAHWGTKARATAQCRRDARLCAIDAVQGKAETRFTRAILKVTFHIKDERFARDPDNALASAKPFIDGCVDAAIIPDDDKSHLLIEANGYAISKVPMTVLEFREWL